MPRVAAPFLDRDVTDLGAFADEDLGRAASIGGGLVVAADVLVQVVEPRAAPGDDQGVGQKGGATFVRCVLAHDRLLDLDSVRHVEESAAGEERSVQCAESIAVGLDEREQERLDELWMLFRGHA